jgi:flagellar capping protein FliD
VLSALGIDSKYTTLSSIGIKLPSYGTMSDAGKSGELEFDVNTFRTALINNPDEVAAVFRAFSEEMDTYMNNTVRTSQVEVGSGYTAAQGSVAREMNHIDDQIRAIDKYIADFSRRLEQKRANLFSQYAAAESAFSKLMQQAQWLESVTSQLQSSLGR